MTTLYHRATPRQDRVLRMIEGAVRNAAHAHPDMSFDPRLTRSIAKRAAGTLTADKSRLSKEDVQLRVKNLIVEDSDTGCWLSPGDISDGYRTIKLEGKRYLLHRVSYEVFVGPIPLGSIIRHRCDNPPCCNPAHLISGTNADNSEDREIRNRGKTNPLKGSIHPRAKLNEDDVLAIRERAGTNLVVAESFGVSESLIQQIRTRKRWGHLPDCNSITGVLAVPRERSESGGGEALIPSRTEPASTCLRRAGASQLLWRTPLWSLKLAIGEATMRARKEGRVERVEAFVDVMRLIAIIIEADQPPNRRSRYTIP